MLAGYGSFGPLTCCSVTAHDAALYLVHLVLVLLASFVSDVQVVEHPAVKIAGW